MKKIAIQEIISLRFYTKFGKCLNLKYSDLPGGVLPEYNSPKWGTKDNIPCSIKEQDIKLLEMKYNDLKQLMQKAKAYDDLMISKNSSK